jgi:hypothetical protein
MKTLWSSKVALVCLLALAVQAPVARADQSGDPCHTLETCRELQARVATRISEILKALAPDLGDFARHPGGVEKLMTYYDAEAYCHEQGQRLPTVRELAAYAQTQEAQGISEVPKSGYFYVQGTDQGGNPDSFYYSSLGYRWPKVHHAHLWSSSILPSHSPKGWILSGATGEVQLFHLSRERRFASGLVRCVR